MKLKTICAWALAAWVANSMADNHTWYPSKWGKDDELGAANMNGPALTLEAAKLIRTGKTYRLGIESNPKTPAYPPRNLHIIVLAPNQLSGKSLGTNKMTYADDIINGWVGVGSQLDGLGHAGVDQIYYNGAHGNDFIKPDGLTKFGTHALPPVVTRGVMIDMAKCAGKDILDVGYAYTKELIEACAAQQKTEIRRGDVVLFNSGWMNMMDKDLATYNKGEPGLGKSGAEYLAGKEVMMVGADTWALEVLPSENKDEAFPIHQILLPKNGIYILENMDTRELAKDQGYEFMFVLGPARMTGAVQMIINPIAIR
ncbi:MAG: cyclase family protein [Gammaproteobacteria bacterium]